MEQGSHAELLSMGGIYSKLVTRQMQKMQNSLELGKDPNKENADVVDSLLGDDSKR